MGVELPALCRRTSDVEPPATGYGRIKVSCDCFGGGAGNTPEVLGTYEFDGDGYDILTAGFERSETLLTFIFSPLYGGSLSTYLAFAVDPYWADGEVHKVNDPAGENLDHNDDYILVYEDPVH